MYKLLTPAQLSNKIRMLVWDSGFWVLMVDNVFNIEEEFKYSEENKQILDMLKKMMWHGFKKVEEDVDIEVEKGVESGVINVKGEAVAIGIFCFFQFFIGKTQIII